MSSPQNTTTPESSMSVIDAIYHRRTIRDYLPQKIEQDVIRSLLDAVVQAPTAVHEEPWSFIVIQNQDILNRLSTDSKAQALKEADNFSSPKAKHVLDLANDPNFNAFYNAGTLIIIYSKVQGQFVSADCWLGAENLMLAALAKGLGTCVIGFAVSALNTPKWKAELGVPVEMTAVAPIIVGLPAGEAPPVPRKQPEIFSWK